MPNESPSSPTSPLRIARFAPSLSWVTTLEDERPRFARSPSSIERFSSTARERWSSRWTFVLASIGSAVGFGNVWRFPMLAYRYGGGAFLVPYFFALFVAGIPMVVLEFSLGQMMQAGHVEIMARLSPLAEGFGWATSFGSFCVALYYSALLAYSACYLVASFRAPLPWVREGAAAWYGSLVQQADGVDTPGAPLPWLVAGYAFVWSAMYLGVRGTSNTLGRLSELLMPLPVVVLLALLVRGLSLEGSRAGLAALFTPDFAVLRDQPEIWIVAIAQIFFSASAGLGALTTYASYNHRTQPIVSSAAIVGLANSAFSILAACTVFAFLGHLAHTQGVPISAVAVGGTSLAFEVFPQVLALMPWPQLWAVAFFVMLVNLGVTSAPSMTTPLTVGLTDLARSSARVPLSNARVRELVPLALHALGFCAGLVYVSPAGPYWIELSDHFDTLFLTVATGLGECLLVTWAYGVDDLLEEIAHETGEMPRAARLALKAAWCYVLPALLSVLGAVQVYAEFASPFAAEFPAWFLTIGYLLGLAPMTVGMLIVPLLMLVQRWRRARAEASEQQRAAAADGGSDTEKPPEWYDAEDGDGPSLGAFSVGAKPASLMV